MMAEQLKKFDGADGSPGLYLSILGQIFDVSSGSKLLIYVFVKSSLLITASSSQVNSIIDLPF